MLVSMMALTGVRGLIAINFVTLPIVWIYVTALLFCPIAQGSLSCGSGGSWECRSSSVQLGGNKRHRGDGGLL